jgi:hypothetical protein
MYIALSHIHDIYKVVAQSLDRTIIFTKNETMLNSPYNQL